ncbi:MAG: CheR family methyltransferase [Candidatus Methylomirabilia bacterium]
MRQKPGAPLRRSAHVSFGGSTPLVPMPEAIFYRFSELIQQESGIKMPAAKKTMLEARLRKRLKALHLEDFEYYCDYVFSPGGFDHELVHLLDVVTTNKTDFFREAVQFEYLQRAALPTLLASGRGRGPRSVLRAWSAGCATGEEAYTLAMVLEEFRSHTPAFEYQILATDLSTRVLATAARGVFRAERIEPVPGPLRSRYIMRSRNRAAGLVRVHPDLRARISFQRLNFRDQNYEVGPPLDLVFCRNVLIYFDKEFQRELLLRLIARIAPGGYLFLGHTESIHGMGLPVIPAGFSTYRTAG